MMNKKDRQDWIISAKKNIEGNRGNTNTCYYIEFEGPDPDETIELMKQINKLEEERDLLLVFKDALIELVCNPTNKKCIHKAKIAEDIYSIRKRDKDVD